MKLSEKAPVHFFNNIADNDDTSRESFNAGGFLPAPCFEELEGIRLLAWPKERHPGRRQAIAQNVGQVWTNRGIFLLKSSYCNTFNNK